MHVPMMNIRRVLVFVFGALVAMRVSVFADYWRIRARQIIDGRDRRHRRADASFAVKEPRWAATAVLHFASTE